MQNPLQTNPAATSGLVSSVVALAVSFGLNVTAEQVGLICAALTAVLGFWVRSRVSPVPAPPKDPPAAKPPSVPPLIPAAAFMACVLGYSLLFVPAVVGCSSTPAQVQAVQAREVARASYSSAVVALTMLRDAHAVWVASVKEPTPKDIEAFTVTLKVLEEDAGGALAAAKPWVEQGAGGSEAKEKLLAAVDAVLLGAAALGSAGGKVPPELMDALHAARALLGGGS